MANTYAAIAVQPYPSNETNPTITITATVNTVPVSIQTLLSIYMYNLPTAVGFQNWIQPLLLNAYNATLTTAPPVPPITGWTG